jgi:hypothetical protein
VPTFFFMNFHSWLGIWWAWAINCPGVHFVPKLF